MALEGQVPQARGPASWAGLFDTVAERDTRVTDIEGGIPEGLVGTFYRNGPGRRDFASTFFDGDGMIRAIRFGRDGSVTYRSRYVRTVKYLSERDSERPLWRTAGTNRPGGPLRNFFRVPAHEANTNVCAFGGGLWALEEGGHPYPIDPESLETGPLQHFDGALHLRTAFTAHPHLDPISNDAFAFGLHFGGPRPELRTFRVDRCGGFHSIGRIPLRHAAFVHDYALSGRWMAFFIPPAVGNVLRFLLGFDSFFESIRWRPELGTSILLVPRDGGPVVSLETDACMVGHFVGAWDDGADLVVDVCQLENWQQVGAAALTYRSSDWAGFGAGSVWRYRITPTSRRIQRERVCDLPAEFPVIPSDRECRGARWAYLASNTAPGEGGIYRGVLKLDCQSGKTWLHDFGPEKVSLQPTFVPRPGARDEDDGWILTVVHDARSRSTEIPILDARAIADGPICTLRIHENLGTTFHGCWIAG